VLGFRKPNQGNRFYQDDVKDRTASEIIRVKPIVDPKNKTIS